MKTELKEHSFDAIVRRIQAYGPYPITRISTAALTAFHLAAATLPRVHRRQCEALLKLLECFLCVTQRRVRCSKSGLIVVASLHEEFMGAIYSPKFLCASVINRYALARAWSSLMKALEGPGSSTVCSSLKPSSTHVTSEIQVLVSEFNALKLDDDEVFFWRSSQIQNRKGVLRWVALRPVGVRYGRPFCTYMYDACQTHIFARDGRIIEVNYFLDYLAKLPAQYTAESFRDSAVMEEIWAKFKRQFVEASLESSTYSTIVGAWRAFHGFAHAHLIGVGPFGKVRWGMSKLPHMDDGGHGPNTDVRPDGTLVAQKLLVEVPLQVTDDAALTIIFEELGARVKIITRWARASSDAIWKRHLARLDSAACGQVESTRIKNVKIFTDDQFACMAAKFEASGFLPTNSKASPLAQPLYDAAYQLGLPTTGALLPHMALLVIAHPNITPSFLSTCELYDKSGQVNGFVNSDKGPLLQGQKPRRGPYLAQQVIYLTPDTEKIVNQVVVLTTPLRDFLKSQGNDNWRKLFLTCGQGFGVPKPVKGTGLTSDKHRVKELASEFISMGLVTEAEAVQFVRRFSLTALRASTAVISYVQNPDSAALAKTLGHAKYSPALLSRYIPAPLLAFFQQRWVRLFQSAIVATAMEDSEFRLRATGFATMEVLHEFLKNHALKIQPRRELASAKVGNRISAGSRSPIESNSVKVFADEVVFGVSVENLTALLSLSIAVNQSTVPIVPTARYWAAFGERLVAHIESCDENSADLHNFLVQARALATPASVEAALHA